MNDAVASVKQAMKNIADLDEQMAKLSEEEALAREVKIRTGLLPDTERQS